MRAWEPPRVVTVPRDHAGKRGGRQWSSRSGNRARHTTSGLRSPPLSGSRSGNQEMMRMGGQAKTSLAGHRARMARRGFVRVEVNVSKDDARLVRQVAAALADPARQAAARAASTTLSRTAQGEPE